MNSGMKTILLLCCKMKCSDQEMSDFGTNINTGVVRYFIQLARLRNYSAMDFRSSQQFYF